MSRKSAAALAVVVGSIDGRPKAPDDLTPEEKEIWERTVAGEAVDMFRTAATQQLLKEYCRHVITAARLSEKVNEATKKGSRFSLQEVDILLRGRDRETKALGDKAVKLRLTNQSRYTPGSARTAQKKAAETKLWDRERSVA